MENNLNPPLLRPPKYSIQEWLYGYPSDSDHGPGPLDDLQTVASQTFSLIADVRAGRPITNATYANFVEGLIVASRYFCDVPKQISELIVAASRPLSTSTTFHGGFLFEGFNETTEDGNWWLNVTGQTAHETANIFFGRLHISLLTTVGKVRMYFEHEMDTDDWKTYFNDWSHLDYEFTEGQLWECNEFIVCRSVVQRELQRAEWDENEANRLLEQMRIEEVQLKCFLRSKPWKEVEQLLSVVCGETEAETKQDNVDSTSTAAHVEPIESRHSDDFASVYWFGKIYEFTTTQAACVQVLWKAWENKTPCLSNVTILEEAGISNSQDRLDKVFRVKQKPHPAWKTMIVSYPTFPKGKYGLNPNVSENYREMGG